MFVISPADELILMTYGAASIPRIAPRPSLDCLPEPKVPIKFPDYLKNAKNSADNLPIVNKTGKSCYNFWSKSPIPKDIYRIVEDPETETETIETPTEFGSTTANFTYEFNSTPQASVLINENQIGYLLPPTPPPRPTPRSSLKRSTPVSSRRESRSNRHLSFPNTPTPDHIQQQILPPSALKFNYDNNTLIMQQQPNDRLGIENEQVGVGGMNSWNRRRSRSPSILVEPATPTKLTDPTKPLFGPGWGRPMSPMDLPPENKSPTVSNKSKLRPKLHIPLGRLGRSTSSEHRESSRLREDLHLQVENPIFNSENLRQRNFDAFFESGEPVYKLHPKTPASAPVDSSSIGSYTPSELNKCAGVYDSSLRGNGASSHGEDLFERSPHEEKSMNFGTRSPEATSRNRRAKSVCTDGGGVPQKGDRCPENFYFHCLI